MDLVAKPLDFLDGRPVALWLVVPYFGVDRPEDPSGHPSEEG
jgi:hypothetical protein